MIKATLFNEVHMDYTSHLDVQIEGGLIVAIIINKVFIIVIVVVVVVVVLQKTRY